MTNQKTKDKLRARAVIIHQDRVLVIKRTKPEQEAYWVFPGGGVDDGETPEQAVQRECHEELGVDIRV
jgi:8-oxo-dGTP diphosphatase